MPPKSPEGYANTEEFAKVLFDAAESVDTANTPLSPEVGDTQKLPQAESVRGADASEATKPKKVSSLESYADELFSDSNPNHSDVANTENTFESPPSAADTAESESAIQQHLDVGGRLPEFKVVVADTSEGHEQRTYQEARSRFEEAKSNGGFFKKIWYEMSSSWQFQRRLDEVKKEFESQDSAFMGDSSRAKQQAEDRVIVEKFAQENDELLDSGESQKRLDDSPESAHIKTALRELISDYASGRITRDKFDSLRDDTLRQLADEYPDLLGKGMAYADNLTDVAEQVRKYAEAGQSIEAMLESTQFVLASAREHLRTDEHLAGHEKVLQWLDRNTLLSHHTTVAAAVSIAYSVGRWSSRSVASTLTRVGVIGAGAGAFAAVRKGMELKQARSLHTRQMAEGGVIEDQSRQRELLEGSRVKPELADNLRHSLDSLIYETDSDGNRVERRLSPQEAKQVLGLIAEIGARRALSDREQVDLLAFSSTEKAQAERYELYMSQSEATAILRRQYNDNTEIRALFPGMSLNELLELTQDTRANSLGGEIEEANGRFKSMRRKEMAKAGVQALLTGIVLGTIVQEGTAFLRGDQQGLLESWLHHGDQLKPGVHETLLHRLLPNSDHLKPLKYHTVNIGKFDQVRLPEEYTLRHHGGSYQLFHGDKLVDNHLKLHDGVLDKASIHRLQEQGFGISVKDQQVGVSTHSNVPRSVEEYAREHNMKDLVQARRQFWYDNNTSGIFEKNELGLWWGGHGGIDSNGNYIFDVSHMTSGGSSHGAFSADAMNLATEGKLKIFLSMSRGTQSTPFMIDIDRFGHAVIPKNSEAGRLLFENVGGRAHFLGRYAEAAQVVSQKNGVVSYRPLATYSGRGVEQVTDRITKVITEHHRILNIVPPAGALSIDTPPVIPIATTTGLEALGRKKPEAASLPGDTRRALGPDTRKALPNDKRKALPSESVLGPIVSDEGTTTAAPEIETTTTPRAGSEPTNKAHNGWRGAKFGGPKDAQSAVADVSKQPTPPGKASVSAEEADKTEQAAIRKEALERLKEAKNYAQLMQSKQELDELSLPASTKGAITRLFNLRYGELGLYDFIRRAGSAKSQAQLEQLAEEFNGFLKYSKKRAQYLPVKHNKVSQAATLVYYDNLNRLNGNTDRLPRYKNRPSSTGEDNQVVQVGEAEVGVRRENQQDNKAEEASEYPDQNPEYIAFREDLKEKAKAANTSAQWRKVALSQRISLDKKGRARAKDPNDPFDRLAAVILNEERKRIIDQEKNLKAKKQRAIEVFKSAGSLDELVSSADSFAGDIEIANGIAKAVSSDESTSQEASLRKVIARAYNSERSRLLGDQNI